MRQARHAPEPEPDTAAFVDAVPGGLLVEVVRGHKDTQRHRQGKALLAQCLRNGRFSYRHLAGKLTALRTLTRNRAPAQSAKYDADYCAVKAFVAAERRRAGDRRLFMTRKSKTVD